MLRELPHRSFVGRQLQLDRGLPLTRWRLWALLVVAGCGSGGAPAPEGAEPPRAGRWAGPFACSEGGCEQHDPPLPSDGEWECRDELGALVCLGGVPAAGVVEGPRDPAFDCATLAEPRGGRNEVCVALTSALPDGDLRGWRCVMAHEHGERRRCVPDEAGPPLLSDCIRRPCEVPLVCAEVPEGRRCVPPARTERACWIDGDCDAGVCVLGRCTGR